MNSKSKSVFKALSKDDQQRVLDLCAAHPYDDVVDILARPRPEGLQLKTSYSALCRFYCSHNSEARKAIVLDQAAASLQYLRQGGAGSFRTAILTMLESRIFEALRKGTPVAELKDDFNVLKDFQKGFIAEEKWRLDPDVDADKELSTHRTRSNYNSHYDFVPADEHGQPADIPPLSDDEISKLNSTDEVTPADVARLDYNIAAHGRRDINQLSIVDGYPRELVQQRLKAYEDNLRARGLTPVQAAIEARRNKLLGTTKEQVTIHQKSLANPHNPPKSTKKIYCG